ncbi:MULTISPECIES: hypothetical protein [unclassified Streptomyces]|uniref:hypothetical protein n=1 Tax=unclassified Streptomyces TaxID=2593676 RepID=UPI0023663FFC|nr:MULTISPECIES: hypothetical protein [unclassified Streptomyces]MDF3146919.1 hypothetical protein [Streptomyces sp. T21Q-yed]WDF43312.1 hypothetical protein PBV52_44255 [Streptomyces sp. T12]
MSEVVDGFLRMRGVPGKQDILTLLTEVLVHDLGPMAVKATHCVLEAVDALGHVVVGVVRRFGAN